LVRLIVGDDLFDAVVIEAGGDGFLYDCIKVSV
jgi:hypothetical protein